MIHYLRGDATLPLLTEPNKNAIICHCCNNVNAWGAGFVIALNRRFGNVAEIDFHKMNQVLGNISVVKVFEEDGKTVAVCNIIGQEGIYSHTSRTFKYDPKVLGMNLVENVTPPVRYWAIEEGLRRLRKKIGDRTDIAIHMPRMGCGLAGGEWSKIEMVIRRTINDLDVYVYDFD